MRKSMVCIASFALCGGMFAAAHAGETPSQLAAQAKISPAQARAIALKARPGKIVKHELEQEAGGSGLRYSFDIGAGKHTYEVGVDARTGKVLENSLDDNASD